MMPAAILRPSTRRLLPPRHAALDTSTPDGILRTGETEGPRLPAVVAGGVARLDGGDPGEQRDGLPPPAGAEGAMISGLDACLEILSAEEDGPLTKGMWRRLMAALGSCRVQSAPRVCEATAAVALDPDASTVEEMVRRGGEGLEEQLIPDAGLMEVRLGPRGLLLPGGRRFPDRAGNVEAAPGEVSCCPVRSACPPIKKPEASPCLSLRGTLSVSLLRDLVGLSGDLVLLLSPLHLLDRAGTPEEKVGPKRDLHCLPHLQCLPHVMLGVMATPPFRDTG